MTEETKEPGTEETKEPGTEETEGSPCVEPEPLAISLDLELATLANAARGAEILADYQTRHGFMDEESEEDAPSCIMSILSLLGQRFEQVRRVVRGEESPARIWGPHNAISVPESLEDFEGDVILISWGGIQGVMSIARPTTGKLSEIFNKLRAELKASMGTKPAPESP